MRPAVSRLVLILLACSCAAETFPVTPRAVGDRTPLSAACSPFDDDRCVVPWPSNTFTIADESTATGLRVQLDVTPINPNDAGDVRMSEADGFSRVSSLAVLFEGTLDPAMVEGQNTKAWHQFRVSMDWPRSDEDRFYLAIFSMASKDFVPKAFLRRLLDEREHWKKPENVDKVYYLAWATNYVKMGFVGWRYFRNGELTWFKLRQYGSLKKMISQ